MPNAKPSHIKYTPSNTTKFLVPNTKGHLMAHAHHHLPLTVSPGWKVFETLSNFNSTVSLVILFLEVNQGQCGRETGPLEVKLILLFANALLIQWCIFVGKTVLSALESKLNCDRNSLFRLDSIAIISAVRTTFLVCVCGGGDKIQIFIPKSTEGSAFLKKIGKSHKKSQNKQYCIYRKTCHPLVIT